MLGTMTDVDALIKKYALQNAIFHDGKAVAKAVLGKIIAEDPKLSERIEDINAQVKMIVTEVNLLSLDDQRKELEKIAPELLKKEKGVKTTELPKLPNVKDEVVMRFAPYPSGPLHIGNARAAILNDEYVKRHNGRLLLVYDDTIGGGEKSVEKGAYGYIKEGLDWLGIEVHDVYYKSDRMQIYYDWVEELVKFGYAYVCECETGHLRACREGGVECEHRSETVDDNANKWLDMLGGIYGEGEAVLRLKTDMKHPNPAFRDRVLFRISDRVHPRVGTRFKVWPLLEFSWAVDDYLLGITHVLRGKDLIIEDEMEKFLWNIFEIEPTEFVHYGMLRLEEMKLSKSKMKKDIEEGVIEGIDDPRTWSLQSLRRRGIRPQAVRNFILGFGLSLTDIEVPAENLYAENRKLIDPTANRYFFVPNPVKIKLKQLHKKKLELPLHPDDKKRGHRTLHLKHDVFVSKEDFEKLEGQEVRLKDFCNVTLGKEAEVTSVENKDIPRIQWVSEHALVKVVMPDGSVLEGHGEKDLKNLKEGEVVQFERFGFVRMDTKKGEIFYFAHK